MKTKDISHLFNPLYVTLAGVIGGFIIVMLSPRLQVLCSTSPNQTVCKQAFSVWLNLIAVVWIVMAILFIPGWRIFISLFNTHVAEKSIRNRNLEIAKLIMISLVIAISAFTVYLSVIQIYPGALVEWNEAMKPIEWEAYFIDAGFFVVILPYALGIYLIAFIIRESSTKIPASHHSKKSQTIIDNLIMYRKTLHTLSIVIAILLGLFPVAGTAFRAYLVAANDKLGNSFPASGVILWGLGFSLLLLFFYFPARLALSVVGEELRDKLFPLSSLAAPKDILDNRRAFDDLMETRLSYSSSLFSSIVTLIPLISSFLGFLGIK